MRREEGYADSSGIRERDRRALSDCGAVVTGGQDSGGYATRTRRAEGVADTGYSGEAIQRRPEKAQARQAEESEDGEIDPLSLPYVMMSELRYLPVCSGVYFAIEESGQVAYIGQSVNIRRRWRAHHVQDDLCDLGDLNSARRVRVAWLQVEKTQLDRIEVELIRRFKPRLNANHIPVGPKPTLAPKKVDCMVRLRLSELLEEREYTLYWLSKQTGIGHTILHRYRHNQSEGIKFEHLEQICNVLECTPNDLIVIESSKKSKSK
jgi:putative transcriptional regulator